MLMHQTIFRTRSARPLPQFGSLECSYGLRLILAWSHKRLNRCGIKLSQCHKNEAARVPPKLLSCTPRGMRAPIRAPPPYTNTFCMPICIVYIMMHTWIELMAIDSFIICPVQYINVMCRLDLLQAMNFASGLIHNPSTTVCHVRYRDGKISRLAIRTWQAMIGNIPRQLQFRIGLERGLNVAIRGLRSTGVVNEFRNTLQQRSSTREPFSEQPGTI